MGNVCFWNDGFFDGPPHQAVLLLDEVDRIGFFFEATRWSGEPVNREPEKCLGLEWFSVHELPDDIIEYPEKGLLAYLEGDGALTEHGWE